MTKEVSVPVRGMGCVENGKKVLTMAEYIVSVPVRGVGCVVSIERQPELQTVSVPVRGVGCVAQPERTEIILAKFPSP